MKTSHELGTVGRVLSVDPSGRALGWCLWSGLGVPIRWGVINVEVIEGDDWHSRNVEMVERVMSEVIETGGIEGIGGKRESKSLRWLRKQRRNCLWTVLIEQPRHFSSGVGEKGEAAMRSGAILKMYHLIGLLEGTLKAKGNGWKGEFIRIPVEMWKGQSPKEITAMRVKREWGIEGDHNMIDAVGIGRWWFRKGKGKR